MNNLRQRDLEAGACNAHGRVQDGPGEQGDGSRTSQHGHNRGSKSMASEAGVALRSTQALLRRGPLRWTLIAVAAASALVFTLTRMPGAHGHTA